MYAFIHSLLALSKYIAPTLLHLLQIPNTNEGCNQQASVKLALLFVID